MYKDYRVHLRKVRERYHRDKTDPEWREKFRIRTRKAGRKYRELHLEEYREKKRNQFVRNKPHIPTAHSLARCRVNNALVSKLLVKPEKCPRCGESNSRIEGHHLDYNSPLKIVWLCSICHGKDHRKKD